MTTVRFLQATLACLALAGCSSSTEIDTPPTVTGHLYVGDDNANGSLRVYTLPLSTTSTPVAMVPMNAAFLIGVNSTTLAVTTLGSQLNFFTLPITSASTPYASFAAGNDATPTFLPNGTLYQGGSGNINIYSPPFTNASTPSGHVLTGGVNPGEQAIDPAGNVYFTTGTGSISVITNGVLTTTMTAADGNTQFRGLAATTTQLFACEFLNNSYNVQVYTLPLTVAALPAVTINVGSSAAEGCAVDSKGDLYVGTSDGRLLYYTAPFTNSSTPKVTLTTPAIIFGIAIGA